MSLPGITAPGSAPAFLVTGHSQQADGLFASLTTGAGHLRRRRVGATQLRRVTVEWFLTAAQMAAVDDWFENALVAGSLPFSARIENEGVGTVWWSAKWAAPWSAEPINAGKAGIVWHVVGQLVLSGSSSTTPPITSDLSVEFSAALVGSAIAVVPVPLAVEFSAALQPATPLAAEFEADLVSIVPYYLLIGGGFRLLIGGGNRLRIS